MLGAGIALAGAIGLLTAGVYGALGCREMRRSERNGQLASVAMGVFWLGLSIHVAIDSAWGFVAALGLASVALSDTVLHLKVATGAVAFGGLVYHLLFLYTGREGRGAAVALYFLAALALVELSYGLRDPQGHEMTAWAARHAFAAEGGLLEDVALVLLFLPGFVASVAYALLLRATSDARMRRRVLLRTLALAGFFGGMLVGFVADWTWWEPVERSLGLMTGLVAVFGAPDPSGTHQPAPQSS